MQRKINSRDISIIIQGSINNKDIKKTLVSIRKHLPLSEIIISTWENTNIEHLENLYDISIFNKDPKGIIFNDVINKTNNINRILISTQNGIKAASKKYVLKLRGDLILKNNNLLNLEDDLRIRNQKHSLFKEKIFAYDIFSIKYDIKKMKKQRMLFHISDWCYFGLKEDLEELFNVPLVEEPQFSRYFEGRLKPVSDIHKDRLWKMSPEQYIVSRNAKKIFNDLQYENYLDTTSTNIEISKSFIINNFRVFTQKEWGISTQKQQYKKTKMFLNNPFTYYSKLEQMIDYNKYLDGHLKIKNLNLIKKMYSLKYYEQLRKHFLRLLFGNLRQKIAEVILVVVYFFKFVFANLMEVLCLKK